MSPARFKAIRKVRGLTQGELALLLRLKSGQVAISRYERGERRISPSLALLMEMVESGRLRRRKPRSH